jgi:replication factor A1
MAFNPQAVPVQPIASLSPFMGGKHWIKARAVDKGEIRTWNKPNSSGKLFSVTFVDESASIRGTFFNDAVDTFFTMIQNGQVFYIGGGSVKTANRRFNNVNNEYEMSFDKDTQIHVARDAATNIPTNRYNFVPVNAVERKEENSPCDILAAVVKVGNPTKIVTKKNEELTKRDVTLSDQNASIDMTLWNDDGLQFNHDVGTVLALKNVRVRRFNGVTLSYGRDSSIDVAPPIPDTTTLQRWFQATGGVPSKSLSNVGRDGGEFTSSSLGRRYFRHIESEGLGRGEKPDYITVRCTTTFIKTDSIYYDACPTCNKKLTPVGSAFRCEKCNADLPKSAPRYLSTIQCSDGVTSRWLTLFNEAGETFWGISADGFKEETLADPTALTKRAHMRLHKPFVLTLRVKEERGQVMNDGTQLDDRVRVVVQKVDDFLYPVGNGKGTIDECQNLIDSLAAYHL